MFITTFLFTGFLLHEISAQILCWFCRYAENVDPNADWDLKYKEEFNQLNISDFSLSAAHILHSLTVEDARNFFNIEMPSDNEIPAGNPHLQMSNAVLANVPSRPNGYSSPGMHSFVDFMDHVTDPDWTVRGTKLGRLLHVYHMHEFWSVARKAANNFSGVSENICSGALDHANNGIEKGIAAIFKSFKNHTEKPNTTKPLTWDDIGESWTEWKVALKSLTISSGRMRSMGLYTQCLMRKFRQSEQPIDLDGCCNSKTVGAYTYTKVSTGEVPTNCLNNCIYSRDDKPGSKFCFAAGEKAVHCLD